jgi:hypothetical protein
MSGSQHDLERDIGIGLARAEAEIFATESVLSMADSHVKSLSGTLARLKALALQVGLIHFEPIAPNVTPPPIDDIRRAKARRALARSGFTRVTP